VIAALAASRSSNRKRQNSGLGALFGQSNLIRCRVVRIDCKIALVCFWWDRKCRMQKEALQKQTKMRKGNASIEVIS
jgi:hypothetical protein